MGAARLIIARVSFLNCSVAQAFVEKRQRRSGKSTPRTMATQSWLRSLDLHEQPFP
jgi:hypothetical protein